MHVTDAGAGRVGFGRIVSDGNRRRIGLVASCFT
jgi:hypothetical protein